MCILIGHSLAVFRKSYLSIHSCFYFILFVCFCVCVCGGGGCVCFLLLLLFFLFFFGGVFVCFFFSFLLCFNAKIDFFRVYFFFFKFICLGGNKLVYPT